MSFPHTRPTFLPAALVTLAVAAAALAAPSPATAQDLPSIEEMTEGTTPMEGFFNLYWDDAAGSLYWEIADLDSEFLYQISMGSGLGSNPVGIDRGQLRGTHVFEARRIGPRVLLVEPNYEFRAISENASEVQAVRDAFAPSVHWGFDIVARTGERVLVDATDFFMRDARGVANQIAQRGQGQFQLDASRSAIYLPNTKSLPGEHRGRGDAHLHERPPRQPGQRRRGHGEFVHRAPAPFLHPAARPRLSAARCRSARGGERPDRPRLRQPDRRGHAHPLGGAPSPGEGRSGRGALRGGRAHRLLCGSGHARAGAERAHRRGEPGGTTPTRRRASSTPSGWKCCPRGSTRRTSATT